MAYNVIAAIANVSVTSTHAHMDNNTVIMTMDNVVHLTGDIQIDNGYALGEDIFTLPETMRPRNMVYLPVTYTTSTSAGASATNHTIRIRPDGRVFVPQAVTSTRYYHTNGLMFNVNDAYYSQSIGNTGGFTSPLGRS